MKAYIERARVSYVWKTIMITYRLFVLTSIMFLSIVISPNITAYAQQSPAENEDLASGETPVILTATSVGNLTGNHFDAKITWIPADLGQPNKFHVEIFDANQLEPRSPLPVRYDIKIYQGDKYLRPAEPTGNEAVQNEDFSHDYTFVFLQEGSYVFSIEEIQHEGENITIPIQVTPEFPMGILAGMAGLCASIVAIARISVLHPKGK